MLLKLSQELMDSLTWKLNSIILQVTEKYFLPCSIHSFLYVPATGCWKRVGLVELPVIDTSTPSLCMIATPSLTSSDPMVGATVAVAVAIEEACK